MKQYFKRNSRRRQLLCGLCGLGHVVDAIDAEGAAAVGRAVVEGENAVPEVGE